MESCANTVGGGNFGQDSIYEDFQISDKISILFISLKYHIERQLYIKQRFEEVYAARRPYQKILLLLVDCDDNQSYMTDLQLECMKYEFQVIVVWSFAEAGRYLRTLKAYEHRPKANLMGN